jgi:hypothetical protein
MIEDSKDVNKGWDGNWRSCESYHCFHLRLEIAVQDSGGIALITITYRFTDSCVVSYDWSKTVWATSAVFRRRFYLSERVPIVHQIVAVVHQLF